MIIMDDSLKREDDTKKDKDTAEKFCVRVGIADCALIKKISSFDYEDEDNDDENIGEALRSLVKKLTRICDDMAPVLDPNNNISDMKEAAFFDDAARKGLSELYGKIMHLIKKAKLTSLEFDKGQSVSMINEITAFWKKNSDFIRKFYEGIVRCWELDQKSQYSLSYFG